MEGLITINTSIAREPALPTVAVAGHQTFAGVTNGVLDDKAAAFSALRHLLEKRGTNRKASASRSKSQWT